LNILSLILKKFFFNRRSVFRIDKNTYAYPNSVLPSGIFCISFNDLSSIKNLNLRKNIELFILKRYGNKGKTNRLSSREWVGFILYDKSTNDVAGIAWLICPSGNDYFYDKVRFSKTEAHLANDFVIPEFRGKGLGHHLNIIRYNLAFELGYECVSVIVEDHRKAAIHNQKKTSNIVCKNYILKFFGVKLFSISKTNTKINWWYIGPFGTKKWKVIKSTNT
jgi:GNAT superfamily N-acetyltransferase